MASNFFIFQAGKRVRFCSLRAAIDILFCVFSVCLITSLLITGFVLFDYIVNQVVFLGDIFVYMHGYFGFICFKYLICVEPL